MANKVSVRFYTVERRNPNGLSFQQAIELIDAVDHPARQRDVAAGLSVRLERYENDAGELTGEFTRVRTTNFPFEVRPGGAEPLQTDGPIGDGVAFRFRPADHTLAMQYDNRIVSPGRAMVYLMTFDQRAAFKITPKMDAENWQKFRDNPLRKLRVGITSPDHLGDVEDEGAAVIQSFRQLGHAYEAPSIVIEMGMGHRGGALGDAAKGLAHEVFALFADGAADLRSLKAWVQMEEGASAEDINLIDEVLSKKTELDLPANDPDRNYELRRNLLRHRLQQHGNRG